MLELNWGLPVIGYLFLAGVGAGALTVSSSVLLRGSGGGFGSEHMKIARYGALLAPPLMILGTGMIIFELGTFQAAIEHGDFWRLFRFIRLFLTVTISPMSIGSWVLALSILASLGYAYTFLADSSGTGRKTRGWQHASVARRIDFLFRLSLDPRRELHFHRRVRLLGCLMASMAIGPVVIGLLLG